MQPRDFAAYHLPALERDDVRHNLIVASLARLASDDPPDLRRWTLGAPGQCAVQAPGYPIVLGELDAPQCRALAEETRALDYLGVVGPDDTARLFAERAGELGVTFGTIIPQQIQALHDYPTYPGSPGHARVVESADASLFADWMLAFMRAAVPHDPVPPRDLFEKGAGDGRRRFWIVDGAPVSMAGIVRRTRTAAAIAWVYTPPALRGLGYAGSVTAAVAESAFAEGKAAVCLYTDLRNPSSNRCYARIGFKPVCSSFLYVRVT